MGLRMGEGGGRRKHVVVETSKGHQDVQLIVALMGSKKLPEGLGRAGNEGV